MKVRSTKQGVQREMESSLCVRYVPVCTMCVICVMCGLYCVCVCGICGVCVVCVVCVCVYVCAWYMMHMVCMVYDMCVGHVV